MITLILHVYEVPVNDFYIYLHIYGPCINNDKSLRSWGSEVLPVFRVHPSFLTGVTQPQYSRTSSFLCNLQKRTIYIMYMWYQYFMIASVFIGFKNQGYCKSNFMLNTQRNDSIVVSYILYCNVKIFQELLWCPVMADKIGIRCIAKLFRD